MQVIFNDKSIYLEDFLCNHVLNYQIKFSNLIFTEMIVNNYQESFNK